VIYACCTPLRRSVVRGNPDWNGIDYLEVVDHSTQLTLEVHFVNPLGTLNLSAANFRIEGGERIKNINVVAEDTGPGPQDDIFTVKVDQPGDFSLYTLRIVTSASDDVVPAGIDPRLSGVQFSFKVECPSPFDCAPQHVWPPTPQVAPDIDYLAKDYASFRRLMLDRMAVLMPQWKERNAADIGVMLVEALAYTADQLSYQQDAVASETYLRTARKRISLRRHARLMDYFISEGCNARTWVHFEVSTDVPGSGGPAIPAGTKIATQIANQQTVIADDPLVYNQAEIIFETTEPVQFLCAAHNKIEFYTWSDDRCCLPNGATAATLRDRPEGRLLLRPGDILIFEEVVGPQTGVEADANPTHRHAVRLSRVSPEAVPVMTKNQNGEDQEVGRTPGVISVDPVTGQAVVEIEWSEEDALPFPVCLWQYEDSEKKVSVARGNIVLADHGLTYHDEALGSVPEPFLFTPPVSGGDNRAPSQPQPILPRFRPRLANAPLTHAGPAYDHELAARAAMLWSLREVQPVVTLTDSNGIDWTARRDLLNSSGDSEEFVTEIDNDGAAVVRFGDDVHGRRPEPGTEFFARYRVGNGRSGNLGADSLRHIALNIPEIKAVRNPLPAQGGQEPESLEDVRQRAPVAYRVQERAVTAADYAEVTERYPDVQRTAATFRWTGSWHTVFLTVDRSGGAALSEQFETDIRNHVERYRMAGHDLEVDEPRYAALEIDMHICVAADHFRSDVERELFEVFSNRNLPDGRRGLFHPDNFTFGQPVYLSAIYAAAHQVAGVESIEVRTFQRLGVPDSTALESGRLDIDRLEITRLDNDRNFAERGQLTISLGGGK
jgi:Baseplate J-like protein